MYFIPFFPLKDFLLFSSYAEHTGTSTEDEKWTEICFHVAIHRPLWHHSRFTLANKPEEVPLEECLQQSISTNYLSSWENPAFKHCNISLHMMEQFSSFTTAENDVILQKILKTNAFVGWLRILKRNDIHHTSTRSALCLCFPSLLKY